MYNLTSFKDSYLYMNMNKQLSPRKNIGIKSNSGVGRDKQSKSINPFLLKDTKVLGFILILIVFVAYMPALLNGYIWDDNINITDNLHIRSLDGLYKIWMNPSESPNGHYWPMVYSSFWIEYHLWGLSPMGYHFNNLLLHILNGLFVWIILTQLEIPGAWLAAMIFGLHPVHVESVAWITERKNLLSGLFYFLSFLAYLHFQGKRLVFKLWNGISLKYFYWCSLLFFLMAMLSKTITISLPLTLLLWHWWKQPKLRKQDFYSLLPFSLLAVMITCLYIAIYYQQHPAESSLSFFTRVFIASRAIWFYAWKLFWPINLIAIYPKWIINTKLWWQYCFPIATLLLLLILWRNKNKWGKEPLVSVLYFIITLGPVLNILDQPDYTKNFSYVNDHAQYLASIGIIALFSAFLVRVNERLCLSKSFLPTGGMVVLFLGLGVLTWQQTGIYRNLDTLYQDTFKKNPNALMANIALGSDLAQKGFYAEAIPYYRKALDIDPNNENIETKLGIALAQLGKLEEATEHFGYAIKINPNNPNCHYNLGNAYQKQGKLEETITQYKETLGLDSTFLLVNFYLGNIYLRQGKLEEAISYLSKELKINPNSAGAHTSLANVYIIKEMYNDAIHHYNLAVQLDPNMAESHAGLGYALSKQGKVDEAISQYREALKLNPNLEIIRENLQNISSHQKS